MAIADPSMDVLLDLDGTFVEVGRAYWMRIEAKRVPPDLGRPHGMAYSLSLISPEGRRVVGYDNAHPVRRRAGPSGKPSGSFDHRHRGGIAVPYKWVDAGRLLADFSRDVNRQLKELGIE